MSGRCWMVGMFVVAQAMGARITVQVYNPAGAPEGELRRSLGEAGRILRQAGVEARWVECRTPIGECAQDRGPGVFVLSVLGADPRGEGSEDALGFAVLAGRRNGAVVIYPRAMERLEGYPQYADCDILAGVIAHEMGHLLLGSARHGQGIMKANWDGHDFEAMMQRRLGFSAAEVRAIGARVDAPSVSSDAMGGRGSTAEARRR
jgi:hypothetical protein